MSVVRVWGLAEAPPWPPLYQLVADWVRFDGETFFLVRYRRFEHDTPNESVLKVWL